MNDYPQITPQTEQDIKDLLRIITRERTIDITDFENLKNRFMSGRKVGKIPSGAADVSDTDRIGDMNYDENYLYLLTTDGSGGAIWGRIALDTGW